jgi:hypothetical protein
VDNAFHFKVLDDPLERANLKERRREIYERMVAESRAWGSTMLPLDPGVFDRGVRLERAGDRFGAPLHVRAPASTGR